MLAAIGGFRPQYRVWNSELRWRSDQALRQAQDDPLCFHADLFPRDGFLFSLSVWQDAEAMLTFAHSGPHRRIIQTASRMAITYRSCCFPCIGVPTRDQAYRFWRQTPIASG